jgi:hypothetical protein
MAEERGADWIAVAKDGVIFMRVYGQLTNQVVDATRRMQVAALKQRPSGCVILLDVGEQPSLPSAEVRQYAASMAARYPEGILAHTTIFQGKGFFAAAIRSALTGIFMVARSPYPRSVVSSPLEGVQYVRGYMGPGAPDEQTLLKNFWAVPTPSIPAASSVR